MAVHPHERAAPFVATPDLVPGRRGNVAAAPVRAPWSPATSPVVSATPSPALELTAIPARPTWLVVRPDLAQRPAVRLVADRIADEFRALWPPR